MFYLTGSETKMHKVSNQIKQEIKCDQHPGSPVSHFFSRIKWYPSATGYGKKRESLGGKK